MDYRIRTLVDIPDSQLRELTDLGRRHNRSRAALIREAVASYRATHKRGTGMDAFGLWGTGRDGWPGLSPEGSRQLVKALLDTNILIDYLRGIPAARNELRRYRPRAISITLRFWSARIPPRGAAREISLRDSLCWRSTNRLLSGLWCCAEPIVSSYQTRSYGDPRSTRRCLSRAKAGAFLSMIQEYVYHML
jgi:hypothetical protein